MALNSSKIKKIQKNLFCSFYVTMSLHAKNCVCTSNAVACGKYKDKEEKNSEKTLKTSKMEISKNGKKQTLGCWVEHCDL